MFRYLLRKWKIKRCRKEVLNAVKRHPEGATIYDIVDETGYNIRHANAILTVLTKKDLIFPIYTEKGKSWRAI